MSVARLMQMAKAGAAAEVATGWDLSNASYNGDPPFGKFRVFNEDLVPTGVFFKPDGTKMYVVGSGSDYVNEYDLSTAWTVSSASYLQRFSINSQDGTSKDLFFKSDGTKMYMVGSLNDYVNEYNLSTAWDISTASYSQNFSVFTEEASPTGLFFKPDGTEMFITGTDSDEVNKYDLTTAWDISTASYSQNFSVAAQETTPSAVFLKPDGTKMYVLGRAGDDVNEYNLSTAWDISTASYSQSILLNNDDGQPEGLFFKSDGTKMYMVGYQYHFVHEYDLSTAWDVSTATNIVPDTKYLYVGDQENNPHAISFKSDGTKMYIIGVGGDDVNEYNLSTAWDLASASYSQKFSVSAQDTQPTGLFFKPDGTKFYIAGDTGNDINEYSLTTAWDVSTASYVQNFSVATQETSPLGVFFKDDGTKMYVCGLITDAVNEYDLSTAWDISTASYLQNFTVNTSPHDLSFKPDGTKMFVLKFSSSEVEEYDLSTAWDVSTASYSQVFSVINEIISPQGLFVKPDGTRMYITTSNGDHIIEYDL